MQDMTLTLAAMLLLRVGQLLWLGGSVRSKNAAAMTMRLLLDLAIISLAVWAIGGSLLGLNSEKRFFDGDELFGISSSNFPIPILVPFILVISGALHGAIGERTKLAPPLVIAGITGGILFPLVLQLLSNVAPRFGIAVPREGAVALAAAMGGAMAIVGALVAGGRKGKFNRDLSVNFVPSHNVMLQLVGVLLFGVAVSVLIGNGANTLLGLSAAVLASAAFGRFRFGKIDTNLVLAGTIGGLFATSGGVQSLPTYVAVIAGTLAGVVVPWAVIQLELKLRIDDLAGTGPSHLVGAVIGLIAGGLLRSGTMSERMTTLTGHLLMLSVAVAAAALLAWAVFFAFRRSNLLRVSDTAEFDGADLTELDLNAYPDFQQTMIKSHHLREL